MQLRAATPRPGPRRPPVTVGGGERGRAFGACCFAGKLRSPPGPGPGATVAEALDPYADPYADLYADPYAGHRHTPHRAWAPGRPGHGPEGGADES